MPEGPELLYCATLFKKKLANTTIIDIKSYTDKPAIIPKDYIGKVISVDCKGKLMWFEAVSYTHLTLPTKRIV